MCMSVCDGCSSFFFFRGYKHTYTHAFVCTTRLFVYIKFELVVIFIVTFMWATYFFIIWVTHAQSELEPKIHARTHTHAHTCNNVRTSYTKSSGGGAREILRWITTSTILIWCFCLYFNVLFDFVYFVRNNKVSVRALWRDACRCKFILAVFWNNKIVQRIASGGIQRLHNPIQPSTTTAFIVISVISLFLFSVLCCSVQ